MARPPRSPGPPSPVPPLAGGLTRRQLLGLAGAAGLVGGRALAFGDRDKFQIAQLTYAGGTWQPRPNALGRLLWEVEKRTSIEVRAEPVTLRFADPELHRYPFLYLAGDRAFVAPTDDEVARLRRHLQAGGFLLVDSAEGHPGGGFDQSVRQLAARLFPQGAFVRLPGEHVLFKSFYLLDVPAGRILAVPYLEGIPHDDRIAVCYCQNDLGGAWARDNFGQWEHEVSPGGDGQRERAFRLGINLAMYATCLDYKTDQVHVPFILRRRRWRAP